jgi:hypothetical protein
MRVFYNSRVLNLEMTDGENMLHYVSSCSLALWDGSHVSIFGTETSKSRYGALASHVMLSVQPIQLECSLILAPFL